MQRQATGAHIHFGGDVSRMCLRFEGLPGVDVVHVVSGKLRVLAKIIYGLISHSCS